MAKDVIVVVQRDALPTEKESLDILLVSTTGAYPVDTYRDVASVEAVYGPDGPCPNAKVVRKATTLLNQGKTTLAESLVDKFKIVSFEPPSATPASPATFAITFAGELSIAASKNLWVRIGGDDKAVVEITTDVEITTARSSLPCLLTPALPREVKPTLPLSWTLRCSTLPQRAARPIPSPRWWTSLRTSF